MGKAVGCIHEDKLIISAVQWVNAFLLKELLEMVAQLEAVCHEMQQGLSIMNPWPTTHQVIDSTEQILVIIQIKETGDCSLVWFRSMGLQVVMKMTYQVIDSTEKILVIVQIKETGDRSLVWFRSMGLQVVMKMRELERASERSVLARRICIPQLFCQELQQFNQV